MITIRATAAALIVAAFPVLAAQPPGPATSAGAAGPQGFLVRLKTAVEAADRRTIATMVSYPLTVLASGFNIPVKDPAEFLRLYDSVFTPELRCAVVAATLPTTGVAASRNTVTVTPDALMIADGAVWAPRTDGRYRISRIRVLPKAPSVEGRRGIQCVTFAEPNGERTATFAGWLVRQNVDQFVVSIKRGESLQARIEGFRGHDATVRVAPQADPGPRSVQPSSDIGRTAAATAAADGDFRIEVAHLARYCDPPQRYKLTVTVR